MSVQPLAQTLEISIHALREEGDCRWMPPLSTTPYFYPRPPRGGRPAGLPLRCASIYFYPRPPRGGRPAGLPLRCASIYFYPRPPRGGRRHWPSYAGRLLIFLSTPSARRATQGSSTFTTQEIFLSTPSVRRATAKTERKYSAFVSLYTSLHKLQRGLCKASHKITLLLAQSTVIPVRSIPENHVHCLFALAGHQKISTLSCANSGCSPTCSTLVW